MLTLQSVWPKPDPQAAEIAKLRHENEQLRTRLQRSEHIIDVQKKLAELLGNATLLETPSSAVILADVETLAQTTPVTMACAALAYRAAVCIGSGSRSRRLSNQHRHGRCLLAR